MAPPTITLLASGTATAGGTTITTGTLSPAATSQVLVLIFGGNLASAPTVSGLGLNWGAPDAQYDQFAGYRDTVAFIGTGTASSGALTITRGGSDTFSNHAWFVVEVAGTSGKVQSTAGGYDGASDTCTLNYPGTWGADSAGVAFFAVAGGAYTATPRSGWSEIGEQTISGVLGANVQTRASADTAGAATFAGAGGLLRQGYVVEFAGGDSPPTAGFTSALSQSSGALYRTLTLTRTSTPGTNPLSTFTVDWGDGTVNSLLTHTYAAEGTYSVALTETDAGALTDTDTQSITTQHEVTIRVTPAVGTYAEGTLAVDDA